MKKILLLTFISLIIISSIFLTTCFNEYELEKGFIIINLGSTTLDKQSGRSISWPHDDDPEMFDEMNFFILLMEIGTESSINITPVKGETTVTASVPVGKYALYIEVSYNDKPYAEGFVENVEVIGGQTVFVIVPMELLYDNRKLLTIGLDIIDADVGDLITAEPRTGYAGEEITIFYTLTRTALYNNIEFSINDVTFDTIQKEGPGEPVYDSIQYIIDENDAIDDIITITAVIQHTGLIPDPFDFDNPGQVNVTYGDNDSYRNPISNPPNGVITYTISPNDGVIAELNADNGIVTIKRAGTVTITANKAATDVYAAYSKSYTLTIDPRPVTLEITQPTRTLVPFLEASNPLYGPTTTFSVTANGLVNNDNLTITLTTGINGLTIPNNTTIGSGLQIITLTYNRTATIPQTAYSFALSISGNSNYALSGTPSVNVTIYDGQAAARAIPVTQNSIAAFNDYAGSVAGLTRHYVLNEDIVLVPPAEGQSNWTRIGGTFTGSFDGNGKTITGLTMTDTTYENGNNLGMFSIIGTSGIVKNLGLINVNINGYFAVGGIAGQNGGNIFNCFTTGTITGTAYAIGGIVGHQILITGASVSGKVENCYSYVNITGARNVGGIVGTNDYGTINNCFSTGSVSSTQTNNTPKPGGIVGQSGNIGISNNIALNFEVKCDHTTATNTQFGRIAGDDKIYSNNYAWNGMPVMRDGEQKDITEGSGTAIAGGMDGKGLYVFEIKTKKAWDDANFTFGEDEESPWIWEANKMPRLYFEEDGQSWPEHLTDEFIGLPITNTGAIELYLAKANGGTNENNSVDLSLKLELTNANWNAILTTLNSVGKFVNLNLSECTRSTETNTLSSSLAADTAAAAASIGGGLRANGVFDPLRNISTGKNRIVELILPEAAEIIVNGATGGVSNTFNYFNNLRYVDFGDGITTIGDGAFQHNATNTSFYIDKLVSIRLGNSVRIIRGHAFAATPLTSVTFPISVEEIQASAFLDCAQLTTIIFERSGIQFPNNSYGYNFEHFPYFSSLTTAYTANGAGTYTLLNNVWGFGPETVTVRNMGTNALTKFHNLSNALASITAAGNYTVTLLTDQQLMNRTLATGTNITLVSENGVRSIEHTGTAAQTMFTISTAGTSLTLKDITLNGTTGKTGNLVALTNGTFTMSTGSRITGHSTSSPNGAVWINGSDATLNMEGGTITGNTTTSTATDAAGGVYLNSRYFYFKSGSISGNLRNSVPADIYASLVNPSNRVILSGNSNIGTIMLYENANVSSVVEIQTGWTGSINQLHLRANQSSIEDVRNRWVNKYVVMGEGTYTLTEQDVGRITPGNFYSISATVNPQPINPAFIINNSGVLSANIVGSGLTTAPFQVFNITQLYMVGRGTANPVGYQGWTLDAHYRLMADVTLPVVPAEQSNWTHIGPNTDNRFTGSFNGDNNTISNLSIDRNTPGNQGMFGIIDEDAEVRNVRLTNVRMNTTANTGSVVGSNHGTVSNCHVTGNITGTLNTGGLVGNNNSSGTVINSSFSGNVTSTDNRVGGVAGINNSGGTVKNCSVSGKILHSTDATSTAANAGGVVGQNQGTIEFCFSTAEVVSEHTNGSNVGGVTGNNVGGTVENSYSTGAVSSNGNAVGGILGSNTGYLRKTYATGTVRGRGQLGGIVGSGGGTIENNVALNQSLTSINNDSTTIGRVAGGSPPLDTLGSNRGCINMQFIGTTYTVPATPANSSSHGANVSAGTDAGQYNSLSFWSTLPNNGPGFAFGTGNDQNNPWRWCSIRQLPKLWFEP